VGARGLQRMGTGNWQLETGNFRWPLLRLFLDQFAASAGEETFDEVRAVVAAAEVGILEDGLIEGDGGLHSGDHVLAERAAHAVQGLGAVLAPRDQLSDHRVVIGRDGVAGVGVGIEPDAAAARGVIHLDAAGAWAEVLEGILGVDPDLDGVAAHLDVALGDRELFTGGDQDLLLDEVDAGDLLGDRVLDLDALVDFEEVEVALVIGDELHRARVGVMGEFGDGQGRLAHLLAQVLEVLPVEERRRRLLDDLLIAPLDGAVALTQVDDVAPGIAEDLELDVVGVLDELLDVDAGVAEGLLGLGPRRVVALDQGDVVVGGTHAAAATAGDRLDHHRIPDAMGLTNRDRLVLNKPLTARCNRNPCGNHRPSRLTLVAHHSNDFWGRSDESNVALSTDLGKMSILGEETITGVNGIHVGDLSRRNYLRYVKIT